MEGAGLDTVITPGIHWKLNAYLSSQGEAAVIDSGWLAWPDQGIVTGFYYEILTIENSLFKPKPFSGKRRYLKLVRPECKWFESG